MTGRVYVLGYGMATRGFLYRVFSIRSFLILSSSA